MSKRTIRFGLHSLLLAIIVNVTANSTTAQDQDQAVTIVFANLMEVETELFWVDDNSAEHSYGTIAPHGEHSQQTYPGQRWRTRAAGVLIKDFVATSAPISKYPITDKPQTGSAKPARQLRRWKALQSTRQFNEVSDKAWAGFIVPQSGGFTVHKYQVSRDDKNGVVLNKPDGGFFLLTEIALYEGVAGGSDWNFVEAGVFKTAATEGRFWSSTLDERNRWSGVVIEDLETMQWARMTRDGNMVDVWKFQKEDENGVVVQSVDTPGAHMLIAADKLYSQDGFDWAPLASGSFQTEAVKPGNQRTIVGTANRAANMPTVTPSPDTNAGRAIGQQTGSRATRADATAALKIHNDARVRVGVAPMVWSVEIARSAQAYADHLAATDPGENYGHDPNINPALGENLTWISGGQGSAVFGSKDWLEERVIWEENRAGETGHYTQMVWYSTKELGIGHAVGASGSVYIVGRYNKGGNTSGEAPYPNTKVLP